MFQKACNFLDQMGGNHNGAGLFQIRFHQDFVEHIPVIGVQTQHWFVQKYIGHIHTEVLRRPLYLVRERIGLAVGSANDDGGKNSGPAQSWRRST